MAWDPDQYAKFREQRLRPARELLARVEAPRPGVVYDLGCGEGNVTRLLVERWPRAGITGVDDSAEMLDRAAKAVAGVTWVLRSLVSWEPERPADVVFSNAALQWLPDHRALFPRLFGLLAPGGTLAVQMPRNFSAPSHALIAETARSRAWKDRLGHLVGPEPVSSPSEYFRLLGPLAKSVDIWETEYLQVLEGKDAVKEWTKGTWLKQFLDALPEGERAGFEEDYAARLRVAYPRLEDGRTLFPFKRLFIVASR